MILIYKYLFVYGTEELQTKYRLFIDRIQFGSTELKYEQLGVEYVKELLVIWKWVKTEEDASELLNRFAEAKFIRYFEQNTNGYCWVGVRFKNVTDI